MGNDKSKGFINSANSADKDELDVTIGKLKANDVKYKFFPIKLNSKVKNNENQLPSKDIIMEIVMNYLEIREMYQLAMTCKLLYSYLFSDSNEFWRRVGERDGFVGKNGLECKLIYSNLWEKCLEFENDPNYERCLQSRVYTYDNSRSRNYINFERFLNGINRDFNQMIYVLRNEKRNIILRAYIAVYGLFDHGEDQDKQVVIDKNLLNSRLEKIFRILCLTENGVDFENIIDWQETKICNLLSITMDMNLRTLSSDSKQRIEDLFLKTAAFKVDCSGFTKYYQYADGQFEKRAQKIIMEILRQKEGNPNWRKYYNILLGVWSSPEMENTPKPEFVNSFLENFKPLNMEDSIDTVIDLLRGSSMYVQPLGLMICRSLSWVHPRIFEELMDKRYYSSPDTTYYSYVSLVGRYIYTDQLSIDLEIRKRALNHLTFISKNLLVKFNDVSDPFLFYHTWKTLRDYSDFTWKDFKEEALFELKECTYHVWSETKYLRCIPLLRDLYIEEKDRAINQLFQFTPLTNLNDYHEVVEEIFKTLKDYGAEIKSHQQESFFSKLIDYFEDYYSNPPYNCDHFATGEIVKAAEWIQPKYSISKLFDVMKKASESSTRAKSYALEALPKIEALMKR